MNFSNKLRLCTLKPARTQSSKPLAEILTTMEPKEITSNNVFYNNLESIIRLTKESLKLTESQKTEFHKNLLNEKFENYDKSESSHLANADWIILNSIFISMFSHFEYKLFLYCKAIEKSNEFKIKLDNLSGSTLVKYLNYLNLVANIESASKNTRNYQTLTLFQKVRNTLVHNGGIMITDINKKLESHELYKFLKDKKVAMGGSLGIIRITNVDFLKNFYLLCKGLCDEIADEINKT